MKVLPEINLGLTASILAQNRTTAAISVFTAAAVVGLLSFSLGLDR